MVEERNYCLLYILLVLCFVAAHYFLLTLILVRIFNPLGDTRYQIEFIERDRSNAVQNVYFVLSRSGIHTYHRLDVSTQDVDFMSDEAFQAVADDTVYVYSTPRILLKNLQFENLTAAVDLGHDEKYLVIDSNINEESITGWKWQYDSMHVIDGDGSITYSFNPRNIIRAKPIGKILGINLTVGTWERMFYVLIYANIVVAYSVRQHVKEYRDVVLPTLVFTSPFYCICCFCFLAVALTATAP